MAVKRTQIVREKTIYRKQKGAYINNKIIEYDGKRAATCYFMFTLFISYQ